jgi:hypothetical protein
MMSVPPHPLYPGVSISMDIGEALVNQQANQTLKSAYERATAVNLISNAIILLSLTNPFFTKICLTFFKGDHEDN